MIKLTRGKWIRLAVILMAVVTIITQQLLIAKFKRTTYRAFEIIEEYHDLVASQGRTIEEYRRLIKDIQRQGLKGV